MICADCKFYECAMRTPFGGCSFGQEPQMSREALKGWMEAYNGWDWEKFRREAAKDILCAIIVRGLEYETDGFKNRAKDAIMQADELIKQLQNENH